MIRALAIACVLAGISLSACGGTQTPAEALNAWTSSTQLANAVTALLTDSRAVHDAITMHRDAKVIRTVCAELLLDAQGANDSLPTPDGQLTGLLSSAYGELAAAASRCYGAATLPAKLEAADARRSRAIGSLVAGVLRAEAVLGRPIHVAGIP